MPLGKALRAAREPGAALGGQVGDAAASGAAPGAASPALLLPHFFTLVAGGGHVRGEVGGDDHGAGRGLGRRVATSCEFHVDDEKKRESTKKTYNHIDATANALSARTRNLWQA